VKHEKIHPIYKGEIDMYFIE